MMTTMDHDPAIWPFLKNINFCDVRYEKQKGVTYDELSWFMKPFTRYGEYQIWLKSIDGPRICSTEANRTWISPCSSSRQVFFDRISRDANNDGSGFNINYFNIFWEAIYGWWSGLPH